VRLDAQHASELLRRLEMSQAREVRRQADCIAASVTRCEVAPSCGQQIDLEATRLAAKGFVTVKGAREGQPYLAQSIKVMLGE
jgi:hypothetical protein